MSDAVLSMLNWWDGPLEGVAVFEGRPHRFSRVAQTASDRDRWGVYDITPLTDEVAAFESERWAIWLRWRAAWKAGEVAHETHPCLPADSARRAQIVALIDAAAPGPCLRVDAVFSGGSDALHECSTMARVRWTRRP